LCSERITIEPPSTRPSGIVVNALSLREHSSTTRFAPVNRLILTGSFGYLHTTPPPMSISFSMVASARLSSVSSVPTGSAQDADTIASVKISKTLTSVVSFLVVVMAILYTAAFLWVYRYSKENSRPLNKKSGKMAQHYAPCKFRSTNLALN
jgi:hypothetical protein